MVQTELDDEYLPEWMETEEMRQAMNTLRQFSENERSYQLYQARLNYLHQQRSIQNHLEVRSCRQIDEWGNHQDSQEGMGNALEIVCPLKHDYILSQIILVDTPEGA